MMKTTIKTVTAVLLAVVLCASLAFLPGCAQGPSINELYDRVVWLIENSYEANVIMFGEGIPVYERGSEIASLLDIYGTTDGQTAKNYSLATPALSYLTFEEMQAGMEKVYSVSYLSKLFNGLFSGAVYELIDGSSSIEPARFREEAEGVLYQLTEYQPLVTGERIYDYATMEIVGKSSGGHVNVRMNTYKAGDGGKMLPVVLRLVFERDNWFLDSPTY